ncbi:MAG TPA: Clp protease N-terminal domain-containing protein [Candidatus Acidoferrum sp.]|nr:Clp protease N-terminal domain-containing protein [Candidatus Acidoferrum sp.]
MNWLKSFWKSLTAPSANPHVASASSPFVDETICNFTPRAQQVLGLARKEADRLNHNVIGTEHLLLGLLKLGQGVSVNVLQKMGLDLETVRMAIEKKTGTGPWRENPGNIPYAPRVKKVLALATKEAKALNHTYVGTEHILLGLLREGDGAAAQVLKDFNVDIEQSRQEILKELDPNIQPAPATGGSSSSAPATASPSRAVSAKTQREPLDVSKRYDVYCSEHGGTVVVYRNARFKGIKSLFQKDRFDLFYEFVELEQNDGQTIFLGRHSIIKFCEHGVTPGSENVSGKKD